MLFRPLRVRSQIVLVCAATAAAGGAHAAARSGIEALEAATPVVTANTGPATLAAAAPEAPWAAQACAPGTPFYDGFQMPSSVIDSTQYVNVGSFFDRRRRSSTRHFLIKYFEPPTPGRYRIEGVELWLHGTGTRLGTINRRLAAAGIVVTRADKPIFPTPFDLLFLQVQPVEGSVATPRTCVDLDVVLEPGEAAWVVVKFPDTASHIFVGVLADLTTAATPTNPDLPGDFLSPDAGELWYRPDPNQRPTYDWAFRVYATSLPSKVSQTWSLVKARYR